MNYGQLKTLVQQYLECEETTFVANIGQFVKQCEEDVYRQVQLPDLIVTATSTFIAGNQYVPLPSDFISPYYMAVVLPTGEYQMLLSKDHSFIRETYPTVNLTGVPRFFAVFDEDAMLVGPTPDQNYAVELNYFNFPASLSIGGDGGTTWLSVNAENALLYGTVVQGYTYLKGDQDIIKQYTDQYTSALSQLKVIAEGRDRKDSYRKSDRRLPT